MSASNQVRLVVGRDTLTPYAYPQAMEFYKRQTEGKWEAHDVTFGKDVLQWVSIDRDIKEVIAGVLRGFVQTELIVSEYWSTNVARWFPHPDVKLMAVRFGDIEGVHALSYNQLSVSLGLDSYAAFKADPVALNKIGVLIDTPHDTLEERARSLATFSAFTEGVILFSSFAILQWLKTKGILSGVTSVIEYSISDEDLHSEAGCWLFRQLLSEEPQLNTPKLWSDIYLAAEASVKVEHSFIDSVFADRHLSGLEAYDLKQFILFRAAAKLKEIGSADTFNYDAEAAERITSWFDVYNTVSPTIDNFVRRGATYARGAFKADALSLSF